MRTSDKKKNGSKKKRLTLQERLRNGFESVRPHLVYYGLILFVIIAIDLLIRPLGALDVRGFQVGQYSPRVVSAPFEFDYVDEIKTEMNQRHAEALVSPVYTTQNENLDSMLLHLQALTEAIHSVPYPAGTKATVWAQSVLEKAQLTLENRTWDKPESVQDSTTFPVSIYESLAFYRNYDSLWNSIKTNISKSIGRGITENLQPIQDISSNQNVVQLSVPITLVAKEGTRYAAPAQDIRTPMQFFQKFQQRINTDFPDPVKDYAARELARDLIQALYEGPTLIYDQQATEALKQAARDAIKPVIVHVNKDETIIGKNTIVTEQHLQKLDALHNQMRISSLAEAGYLVLSILFIVIVLRYLQAYQPQVHADPRKIAVLLLGIILIFALTRLSVHLSLLDQGSHRLTHVSFAVPLGALGVILTLLITSRLALFICGISAIYMGIILTSGTQQYILPYIIVAFITACSSVYAVTNIRQRSDLYRAGGLAMILACALIFALSLNQYKYLDQLLERAEEVKWALIWGGVNGGLISILSMALLPIFEDFYGVVTDMRLLELSQKNEILQRLEQEAPGSYQHSMRVATLAETAAETIGAHALLTRVGCYYHDIGKIIKPQYFVENQQTSADKAKHSKLTTNMSCFLIRSHVKHGIEMATKYKLPKVIVDFIPEHHGTTLMSYFYHQALEEQHEEGEIKESDFRYPGPKPQSKETAISMLADALEAASRTLENATERDVRQLVRKIINDRFMDGQFDECNLTLKDLHTLFLSFSESIMSMLHQRIAYPSSPSKEKGNDDEKKTTDKKEIELSHSNSLEEDKTVMAGEKNHTGEKPVALK